MTAPEPLREPLLELDVITIFPDYLAPLYQSLVGRAIERGLISARVHDLRTWTDDVHRTVDDTPYGGGPGMVMLPEPWGRALDSLVPPANLHHADVHTREDSAAAAAVRPPRLVIPSPAGRPFSATVAAELSRERRLIFACGRYEGIDARVADYAADRMTVDEVSLGDYVLCGGEVAVLVMVEAVARLLPGVLGNERSAAEDSFTDSTDGLLEAPAYTKPAQWRGLEVPAVLMSGNHGAIARWRSEQSRERTAIRRPDLLTGPTLS